jgi:hypothetical protein
MMLFMIVKSLQHCDNAKLTLLYARAGHLDAIDPCKHAERVLAIPSLLLCLFKISETGSIAHPFMGREQLILLWEKQQ